MESAEVVCRRVALGPKDQPTLPYGGRFRQGMGSQVSQRQYWGVGISEA